MSSHLSTLKNISENLKSVSLHLIPSLKNNSKNLRKLAHPCHISPLKNNSKNSSCMSHHLSLLKNNSKNLTKSPHDISTFSIEK
jgi:hypothetical protein